MWYAAKTIIDVTVAQIISFNTIVGPDFEKNLIGMGYLIDDEQNTFFHIMRRRHAAS